MASLNEISYNLLNKMTGGRSTNNEYLSLDQIKFNINYYRALFIHRDFKRSLLREPFEQEIKIDFENIDNSDATSVDLLFKSTKQIPKYVRLDGTYPLSLYNETFKKAIQIETFNRQRFKKFSRHTKNTPTASIKNNYIYISSDTLSTIIDQLLTEGSFDKSLATQIEDSFYLVGIFENPSEVYLFNGEDPTTIDDLPYPISSDMTQRISQSLINGDLEIMLQTPNDTKHNNLPDHQIQ